MASGEKSCEAWGEDFFNHLDFESKLVEVLEELRLRRKLEEENEKSIKSLLEIKYDLERIIEKERREHNQELEVQEKQLESLKKKFEDNIWSAEDEKANKQHITKMLENEIYCLRDELKVIHAGKLNLEKQVVELKAKLKLHNSFQEAVQRKFTEMKQEAKELVDLQNKLLKAQEMLKNDVNKAYSLFDQCNLVNKQLAEKLNAAEENKAFLFYELIVARAQSKINHAIEVTKAKDTEIRKEYVPVHEYDKKYEELQEKHQKTLENLLEVSKLLNDHILRAEDSKKKEVAALLQLENSSLELVNMKNLLEKTKSELKYAKEENEALTLRIKNEEKEMKDTEIQVNFIEKC